MDTEADSGWTLRQRNRCVDGQTDGWNKRQTYRWTIRQTNRCVVVRTDSWKQRQTDG